PIYSLSLHDALPLYQGKTSNINGLAVAADALKRPTPQVGLTTFRPPYTPTTFGAFCGYNRGKLFDVTRKTPIDSWAEQHGAAFEDRKSTRLNSSHVK